MEFYFSGVASRAEFNLLLRAGVTHILVDQFDLPNIAGWRGSAFLDSGAYKAHKRNLRLNVSEYLKVVQSCRGFDRIAALDVIGNQRQSRRNWARMRHVGNGLLPVWHWGSRRDALARYLGEAPVVGIGGLAGLMRAKGKTKEETESMKRARGEMMKALTELCARHAGRFHLFGCNFLQALEQLKDIVASADSSVWLRGRRYRLVIFEHKKTHHLSIAPARALGLESNGDEISVINARNLEAYLNGQAAPGLGLNGDECVVEKVDKL